MSFESALQELLPKEYRKHQGFSKTLLASKVTGSGGGGKKKGAFFGRRKQMATLLALLAFQQGVIPNPFPGLAEKVPLVEKLPKLPLDKVRCKKRQGTADQSEPPLSSLAAATASATDPEAPQVGQDCESPPSRVRFG